MLQRLHRRRLRPAHRIGFYLYCLDRVPAQAPSRVAEQEFQFSSSSAPAIRLVRRTDNFSRVFRQAVAHRRFAQGGREHPTTLPFSAIVKGIPQKVPLSSRKSPILSPVPFWSGVGIFDTVTIRPKLCSN